LVGEDVEDTGVSNGLVVQSGGVFKTFTVVVAVLCAIAKRACCKESLAKK
jgi:hypothetical protein